MWQEIKETIFLIKLAHYHSQKFRPVDPDAKELTSFILHLDHVFEKAVDLERG